MIKLCISCLFFADDIALLSLSCHGLQKLLDICARYCKRHCLDFNVKKSKVMIIGKNNERLTFCPLLLNGESLDFTNIYKYLGVEICAGKSLTFSAVNMLRSFRRAANAILYSPVKPSKEVLLRLLYTNCVPIITYASAAREFSAADMTQCNVAINNCIRKIFTFAVWQSIRDLRISHGYKSVYELFEESKGKFMQNASKSSNAIVKLLSSQ